MATGPVSETDPAPAAAADPGMTERITEELRGICGASAVLSEPVQLLTYECDALPHLRESPAVVVLPISAEQVQAVVRACARDGVPFVARGSGTGDRANRSCSSRARRLL